MDFSPRRWIGTALVLTAVFLGAVSLHVERVAGWSIFILCFAVGSVGGLAMMWARHQLYEKWDRTPRKHRTILIVLAIPVVMLISIASNYGKPDATFNIVGTVVCICLALALWGCYRLFSALLDRLAIRFGRR